MQQVMNCPQRDRRKMYARAHSLVESACTINEIYGRCDLPQAEVEVLIGFQIKKHVNLIDNSLTRNGCYLCAFMTQSKFS